MICPLCLSSILVCATAFSADVAPVLPTFTEHMRKQWHHATTMAQSLHSAGVRGSYWKLATSPPGAFIKQLVLKRGFLDGYPGWLAAASTACAALIKHAALIELDRSSEPRR